MTRLYVPPLGALTEKSDQVQFVMGHQTTADKPCGAGGAAAGGERQIKTSET